MPRFQFRIRTLLIVIAALAVLMSLLPLVLRWMARMDERFVVFFVLFIAPIFVSPLLLLFILLSSYFRRALARGEFLDRKHPPGPETQRRPKRGARESVG